MWLTSLNTLFLNFLKYLAPITKQYLLQNNLVSMQCGKDKDVTKSYVYYIRICKCREYNFKLRIKF